jgi:hypothetical protein
MLSLPIYKLGSSYYLHTRIAGKQVKKSLRTSYKRVAIIRAVSLLNSLTMSQKLNIEDFPHLLDSKNIQRKYELDLSKGILKADDEEDHQRLLEAIEALKSTRQHFPAAQPQQEHVEPSKLIPDDPTALKLDELLEKFLLLRPICRVPDDWLLKNKRPLLHGREVLQAVLATWQSRAKELPC